MTRYDVKRERRNCYAPTNRRWALVDVPTLQFIAIDGHGDPNTSDMFSRAVQALYAVAYTIKFASKRAAVGQDFVVGPLEGLWWADDPESFITRDKDTWHWRLLIHQPDWITDDAITDAVQGAYDTKRLAAISEVRRETLHEGTCAQVLHVGSYDDEGPILATLHHEYLAAHNLRMTGLHHEIYLSDPRRSDPAKRRTILRQPVEAAP